MMDNPELSYLYLPPDSRVLPPVQTLTDELPFDKISWRDFERLCLAMVEKEFSPADCAIYGVGGQSQSGIDIYANNASGKVSSYQCKKYQSLKPADLDKLVNAFTAGQWFSKTDKFFLCTVNVVQYATPNSELSDMIEK